MQIENHLRFAVVACTYDLGDFLFWLPWQVHNLEPGVTRSIAAHDDGRCRLKLEIVDGPRVWVLNLPGDAIYRDRDLVRIGADLELAPDGGAPARSPLNAVTADDARAAFLRQHRDLVVLADDWIPNARRSRSFAAVRSDLFTGPIDDA